MIQAGTAGNDGGLNELRSLWVAAGLARRQPVWSTWRLLQILGWFVFGWTIVALLPPSRGALLGALALGIAYVRSGMMMHDSCHGGPYRWEWLNTTLRALSGNLLIGISYAWWTQEHNQHHAHPNRDGMDPDIVVPHLVLSRAQFVRRASWLKPIYRWQAWYYFPGWMLQAIYLRAGSIHYLRRAKPRGHEWEWLLLGLHWTVYFAVSLWLLGFKWGWVFVAVHQAAFGIYAGSVFSPGHTGRPVLEPDDRVDELTRQVVTSRNLRANPLTDAWYGGLNYQVEHHVLPTMPRASFHRARSILRDFCRDRGIPYSEIGVFRCYRDIVKFLDSVARPVSTAIEGSSRGSSTSDLAAPAARAESS